MLSPGLKPLEFVSTKAYDKNTLIYKDSKLYRANSDITSGTAFVEGSAANQWSEVGTTPASLNGGGAVFPTGGAGVSGTKLALAFQDGYKASQNITIHSFEISADTAVTNGKFGLFAVSGNGGADTTINLISDIVSVTAAAGAKQRIGITPFDVTSGYWVGLIGINSNTNGFVPRVTGVSVDTVYNSTVTDANSITLGMRLGAYQALNSWMPCFRFYYRNR